MSTILKALRRLEDEKTPPIGQRPLREEVARSSEPARRRGVAALMAGALVAGAALGAVVLFVWPFGEELPSQLIATQAVEPAAASQGLPPSASASPLGDEPERSRAIPPVAAAPRVQESEAPAGDDAYASQVAVVERPGPTPLIADDPEPSSRSTAAAESTTAAQSAPLAEVTPAGDAVAATAKPARAARVSAEPVQVAHAAEPEPSAPSNARAPAQDSEARATPPEDSRAAPTELAADARPAADVAPLAPSPSGDEASVTDLADVRVAQTLWHPTPERRVAVLDVSGSDRLLRVHEGDRVAGFLVAEIAPSAVAFARDGETVRLSLGTAR